MNDSEDKKIEKGMENEKDIDSKNWDSRQNKNFRKDF